MKKIYLFLFSSLILLFSGCASKDVCKRPDMLDLSNETMSFIRGGEFLMGNYKDPFKDRPPKEVYVSSFYIDKTEVTNKMYKEYIDAHEKCKPRKPEFLEHPTYGADDLPVVAVSYKEALRFCEFYNKRLPTEAEWEYAARGALEMKQFPWGDEESSDFMNYRESKNSWAVNVKSYPPNKYDLYDMAGNVREWVMDTYEKDFYKYSCLKSPISLDFGAVFTSGLEGVYKSDCYKDPINLAKGKYKVTRGGSWDYSGGYPNTVYFRGFDLTSAKLQDLGFRCAQSAEKENWLVKKFKELRKKFSDETGVDPRDVSKDEIESGFDSKFKKYSQPPKNLNEIKSLK